MSLIVEKRSRFPDCTVNMINWKTNSSLLDANLTDAGDDYDALNETYVIFITENDVLNVIPCTFFTRTTVTALHLNIICTVFPIHCQNIQSD